jgi:hypothetical protein
MRLHKTQCKVGLALVSIDHTKMFSFVASRVGEVIQQDILSVEVNIVVGRDANLRIPGSVGKGYAPFCICWCRLFLDVSTPCFPCELYVQLPDISRRQAFGTEPNSAKAAASPGRLQRSKALTALARVNTS